MVSAVLSAVLLTLARMSGPCSGGTRSIRLRQAQRAKCRGRASAASVQARITFFQVRYLLYPFTAACNYGVGLAQAYCGSGGAGVGPAAERPRAALLGPR